MCKGLTAAIGSPESPDGNSPCALPGGTQRDLFGQPQHPASHSPSPVNGKAKRTNDTCGPNSFDLSKSADLQFLLASKLEEATDLHGSMEFSLKWKVSVTPARRRICRLLASTRRTKGKGCIGVPTPDHHRHGMIQDNESLMRRLAQSKTTGPEKRQLNLDDAAGLMLAPSLTPTALSFKESHRPGNNRYMNDAMEQLLPAPTPIVNDATGSTHCYSSGKIALKLPGFAKQLCPVNTPRATDGTNGGPNQAGGALPADAANLLASVATPTPRDSKNGQASDATMQRNSRPLNEQAVNILATSTSAPGAMALSRVLDAAYSRWLMGFPSAWDEASPNFAAWQSVQELIATGGCADMATPLFPPSPQDSSKP